MKQNLLLGAFAAAVFLPNFFPVLPPTHLWAPVAFLWAFISICARQYWVCPIVAGLSVGLYGAGAFQTQILDAEYDGEVVYLSARVDVIEDRSNRSQRMELAVTRVWTPAGMVLDRFPEKVLLSWYGFEKLSAGAEIQAEAKLRRPRGLQNPGLFDYQKWLIAEGFGATGYIRSISEVTTVEAKKSWFERWREERAKVLAAQNRLKYTSIHQALSLGDSSVISPEAWDLFRTTGTVHLMVISGLHVGLIAGLGYFFGFGVARLFSALFGWNAIRTAIVFALTLAFFYSAVSGFGLPAKRAMIMLLCVLAPRFFYLNVSPWFSFFVALAVIAVLEPRAVLQTGFWLSFGAVLLLFVVFTKAGKQRFVSLLLRAQLLFFVCFSGVLMWQGLPAPTVSIPSNLLAVPLVSLVIAPLEVLALFVSSFSVVTAEKIWLICDCFIGWKIALLQWFDGLGLHPLNRPSGWSWMHGLAVIGTFFIFSVPTLGLRLALAMSWLPLLFSAQDADYLLRMRVFDVGQGTSILVQQPGYNLLYDTGPKFSESFDTGADIVSPTLAQQGIVDINRLIVSHPDADHRAGLEGVLGYHSVGQLDVGKLLDLEKTVPIQSLCRKGSTWTQNDVVYRYLWPDSDNILSDNDNSCVLSIEAGDLRILIPGDISSSVERQLLRQQDLPDDIDVLIVPHHGSNSSSTMAFISAVSAQWAIVSAGYQNQFNHPHPDVTKRYQSIGTNLLNTADSGAIEFLWESDDSDPIVTLAKESKIFWWQK